MERGGRRVKTPEEIKRGIEIAKTNCLYVECCEDICPYNKNCDVSNQDEMTEIPREMVSDALAYIQQLEQDNAQKDERIRQLEREREAMLRQLSMHCEACKYWEAPMSCKECRTCTNPWKANPKENWEWRGVEEDEHGENH
jgi:ferredoxin